MPRRAALQTIGAIAAGSILPACDRRASPDPKVVLYSSADDEILKQVVAAFEKNSGIKVGIVTDTEATKTTGLVQRLLDEKDRPRADAWWSSEPLGTIWLAREGVLAEHTPGALAAGRPDALNARAKWFIIPGRARVIAYSTSRIKPGDVPQLPRDLALPAWKGRVGMARPQFGTTRSHMGALVAIAGEPGLRSWLGAMKNNGVRLYDGNASVVRAIAQGEIDAGLTDSDDVYAAARNGWAVAMRAEAPDTNDVPSGLPSIGTIVLPNTVGLVAGGPNRAAGEALVDFLLSEEVERMLASHESRHIPVRDVLAKEFAANSVAPPAAIDLERISDTVPAAMRVCQEVLGG